MEKQNYKELLEKRNYKEIAKQIAEEAKEANIEIPRKPPGVERFPWDIYLYAAIPFASGLLLLLTVPFLAIYKVHYLVIAGYIVFVAVAAVAPYFILPRLKRNK